MLSDRIFHHVIAREREREIERICGHLCAHCNEVLLTDGGLAVKISHFKCCSIRPVLENIKNSIQP